MKELIKNKQWEELLKEDQLIKQRDEHKVQKICRVTNTRYSGEICYVTNTRYGGKISYVANTRYRRRKVGKLRTCGNCGPSISLNAHISLLVMSGSFFL